MWRFPFRRLQLSGPHAEKATAAIEFAILAPLFLILFAGIIQIGMAAYQIMQVESAAEAGALYASKHGASSLPNIALAVTSASSTPGITATPAPVISCGCPGAGGVVFQGSNCTSTCPGGSIPSKYVTVSATVARTVLLSSPYLSLPLPTNLTATSLVRVQ